MAYKNKLPTLSEICKIAQSIQEYPTTTSTIIQTSKKMGYGDDTVAFFGMFKTGGRDDEFDGRSDLYSRAAELAFLICEERSQPKEGVLSRQD